jgi:hypothetical protein
MPYIEIADLYLNLDHVCFVRKEEHAQVGKVLAIHFATPGTTPLYVNERHDEELRPLLLAGTDNGEATARSQA